MVVVAGQARFSVSGRDPNNGRASQMSRSGGDRGTGEGLAPVMTVMMPLMMVARMRRRPRCNGGRAASRDGEPGRRC